MLIKRNLQELMDFRKLFPECLGQNSLFANFNLKNTSKIKDLNLGERFAQPQG